MKGKALFLHLILITLIAYIFSSPYSFVKEIGLQEIALLSASGSTERSETDSDDEGNCSVLIVSSRTGVG